MQPKVGDQPDDFGFMTSQRHLVPASMKSIYSLCMYSKALRQERAQTPGCEQRCEAHDVP